MKENQILNKDDLLHIYDLCLLPLNNLNRLSNADDLQLRKKIKEEVNTMVHKRAPEQRKKNQELKLNEFKLLQIQYSKSTRAKGLIKSLKLNESVLNKNKPIFIRKLH